MGVSSVLLSLRGWRIDRVEIHHVRTTDGQVIGVSLGVEVLDELKSVSNRFSSQVERFSMRRNYQQYLEVLDVFFNAPESFGRLGFEFTRDETAYLIITKALVSGRYKIEIRSTEVILVVSELPYINLPGGDEPPVGLFDEISPDGLLVSLPSHVGGVVLMGVWLDRFAWI